MSTTPSPSPTRVTTAEELDALPVGSVVMTETNPATFGVYEQRIWQRFGGQRDWQFGHPRHDWQSTDGGFQEVDIHERYSGTFMTNRVVTVLHNPAAPPVSDTAAATITRRHHVVAAGHSTRLGTYVICACSADEFGVGLPMPGTEYPAHLLAALGLTVTDETGAEK